MLRWQRCRLVAGLLCWLTIGAATANPAILPGLADHVTMPVTSFAEARSRELIRQQYDFSCGAAALATLLTHHYDHPVSEQQVFSRMFELGDQERILQQGFSMLDMKLYLESAGFTAGGYRIDLARLAEIGVPAIALLNINGYLHFVVIKGVRGDRVLIGDPALGLRTVTRASFEAGWNGIFFLIRSHASVGRRHFNRDEVWAMLAQAPVADALGRADLAGFTLQLGLPGLR
ncbi:MAG: C39 family peptidase [Xanthomonadaceae bacterium]|nr:C39 family peptidase [Xanthomonadaceae bacterium]